MTSECRAGLVAAACAIALLTSPATAQRARLDSLRLWWEQGRYADVVVPLIQVRDSLSLKFPERLRVNYMIATSLCRSGRPDYRQKGLEFFDALVAQYGRKLNEDALAALRSERAACATTAEEPPPPALSGGILAAAPLSSQARVTGGKMFGFGCPNQPTGSLRLAATRSVLPEELAGRVFETGARDSALRSLRSRTRGFGDQAQVGAAGRFVLASLSGHTAGELAQIGTALDQVRVYYEVALRLPMPDSLVTVYIASDGAGLSSMAARLHGVQLQSPPSIGYSVFADLSIAALVPFRAQGTLAHELMHLALRYNFPEAPAWLDEGLAALYEVAKVRGDSIVGLPNWRGTLLSSLAFDMPQLTRLVSMGADEFQPAADNGTRYAVNAATARYFLLFLQDRGLLGTILNGLRASAETVRLDATTGQIDTTRTEPLTALSLAARALGLPPRAVQEAFDIFWRSSASREPAMQCTP